MSIKSSGFALIVSFYNEKSKCKVWLSEYKKENIECKICNAITRNYYYKHMKKHPELKSKPQNSVSTNKKLL